MVKCEVGGTYPSTECFNPWYLEIESVLLGSILGDLISVTLKVYLEFSIRGIREYSWSFNPWHLEVSLEF